MRLAIKYFLVSLSGGLGQLRLAIKYYFVNLG